MLKTCKVGDLVTYDYDYYEQSPEKNLIPPIGSVGKVVELGSLGSPCVRWISLGKRWFKEDNSRNFRGQTWYYRLKALSPAVQEDF